MKFKIGDYLRYAIGSTAIMRVDHVSPKHGTQARYYGKSFFGSAVGVYESDAIAATQEEIRDYEAERAGKECSVGEFYKADRDFDGIYDGGTTCAAIKRTAAKLANAKRDPEVERLRKEVGALKAWLVKAIECGFSCGHHKTKGARKLLADMEKEKT